MDSTNVLTHLHYAMALLRRNRNEEAVRLLREVYTLLAQNPDDLFSYEYVCSMLASAYLADNDIESACSFNALATQGAETLRQDPEGYLHIMMTSAELAFVQSDFKKAIGLALELREYIKGTTIETRKSFAVSLFLGKCYQYCGRLDDAAGEYSNFLEQSLGYYTSSFKEFSQHDKLFYMIDEQERLMFPVQFLIEHSREYPEFAKQFFLSRLARKNYLYNDFRRFQGMLSGYSGFLLRLNENEAYIEVIRLPKLPNRNGPVYLVMTAAAEYADYPRITLIENGRDLENRFHLNYITQIKNKTKDLVSYRVFWQKIEDTIPEKKRIFISPDGVFRLIAMDTLLGVQTDQEFIYVNSIDGLLCRNPKLNFLESAAVIGDPILHGTNEAQFKNLNWAKDELDSIELILRTRGVKVEKRTQKDFIKANVIRALTNRTVHCVTHGYCHEPASNGEISDLYFSNGLLLSNVTSIENGEWSGTSDTLLTGHEISQLDLKDTSLVIMSACYSVSGTVPLTGELIGLSLAFFTAGCQYFIGALWEVDDKTTVEFMRDFYKALVICRDPVEALKTAKEDAKKRHPEAYYWGGFILLSR